MTPTPRPPVSLPWSTVAPLVGVTLLALAFALPIVLVVVELL